MTLDIRPGDVILDTFGDVMTVHAVHPHENGSVSLRYRFTSNPRGVDWRGHLSAGADVRLLSRGVARVDGAVRSLLP